MRDGVGRSEDRRENEPPAARVGLDARPALFSRAGIGRYVRELVRALARLRPADLAFALHAEAFARAEPAREEEIRRLARLGGLHLKRTRLPGRLQRCLERFGFDAGRRLRCDLFHVTDVVAPPLPKTPFVATLHDVAWLVDSSFHTRAFRRGAGRRAARLAPRARAVLVPSRASAEQAHRRLGVEPDRLFVVPHGADHAERPVGAGAVRRAEERLARAGVRGDFALCLGTIEPRKNHRRLLDAHARAREAGAIDLVLVGAEGWRSGDVVERLRGGAPGVAWLGALPDDEVFALLDRAAFAVYVSLHEGFGLPVLEAMARGRAVLASRIPPLVEIADGAAHFVDPRSTDALAEGLVRLGRDAVLRRRLEEAGRTRARTFSWAESARRHVEVYRRALADLRV